MDSIPTSLQRLRSLADITNATNGVKDEDYLHLKRDYQNLLNGYNVLLNAVNEGDFSPLSGPGSPEGVYTANYSLLYVDTVGAALYYNPTYGAKTGWVAL